MNKDPNDPLLASQGLTELWWEELYSYTTLPLFFHYSTSKPISQNSSNAFSTTFSSFHTRKFDWIFAYFCITKLNTIGLREDIDHELSTLGLRGRICNFRPLINRKSKNFREGQFDALEGLDIAFPGRPCIHLWFINVKNAI